MLHLVDLVSRCKSTDLNLTVSTHLRFTPGCCSAALPLACLCVFSTHMLGSSIIAGNKPDKEISVPPNAFTEQRLENILIRQSQFESSRKKKTEKIKQKIEAQRIDARCSLLSCVSIFCKYYH